MNKKSVIAMNLRILRLEKGWSQERVCKELKKHGVFIERTTYTKYETGDREPSGEMIGKLALCFTVSADFILGIE